jgi:N-carbamoyl-L-amino-acid hydrolase
MENSMLEVARNICRNRGIELIEEKLSTVPPIDMHKDIQAKLEHSAKSLGLSNKRMVSGAGHDAMSFDQICPTGMIFIPCNKGISHNKMEFTSIENICNGARVLYEYLRRENR